MYKKLLLLSIFLLLPTQVLAISDDELIIGLCSTIFPIGNFSKQIVCTNKDNQKICRETYNAETIKSCKNLFYQLGLLKPRESPQVLMNRVFPSD